MSFDQFDKYLKYMQFAAQEYGAFEYDDIKIEDEKLTGVILGIRVDITSTYSIFLDAQKRRKELNAMLAPLKKIEEDRVKAIEEWM